MASQTTTNSMTDTLADTNLLLYFFKHAGSHINNASRNIRDAKRYMDFAQFALKEDTNTNATRITEADDGDDVWAENMARLVDEGNSTQKKGGECCHAIQNQENC
jgi:hypothetical protein